MEENNQEKLSSLFNNRFKESLKKSISEKENRILDLQIQIIKNIHSCKIAKVDTH